MAALRLHVVEPAALKGLTPNLDALENTPFPRWFSDPTEGELKIVLKRHVVEFDPHGCMSARLHDVAASVLPSAPGRPTNDIALILASSWLTSSVRLFGLMFDFDGEEPALGTQMTSRGIPRQACAVFLDAFDAGDEAAMVHTAVHELGHVFNLQHDLSQSSFMGDSTMLTGFNGDDGERLKAAAQGYWDHAPGGANFAISDFGGPRRASGARAALNLVLEAMPEKSHYLLGEPVVLDIELRSTRRGEAVVPDELDPGYPTLRIWYRTPLGETRLYRSRNVYCRARGPRRRLAAGSSLRNNPKISLGRFGSTLTTPGEYRVYAEFGGVRGRFGRVVRSKEARFEIHAPRTAADFEISSVLRLPGVAACVVDKGGQLRWRERRALGELLRKHPRHSALRYVRYALASYYHRVRARGRAADLLDGLSIRSGSTAEGVRHLRRMMREDRTGPSR